jgi:hypothetical protein
VYACQFNVKRPRPFPSYAANGSGTYGGDR